MKVQAALLVALLGVALAEYKSYDGYRVLRTQHLSVSQYKALSQLQQTSDYDFWKDPRVGRSADIMSSSGSLQNLQEFLASNDIHYTFMGEDVGKMIRDSHRMKGKKVLNHPELRFDWDDYYSHDDINAFLESFAGENGVNVVSIGKTYEGRDMKVIEITRAGADAPIVWIEGGIHAREWIAPAMATYILNELLGKSSAYLDQINFYILPSANPDGYEYSRSDDRLWRKNRSPQGRCTGVDLNRNWGFHWGESGVSFDPCSDVFCGDAAFSELESQQIKAYVEALPAVPVLGHCLHSYSQLWLWPYGYDYNALPENYEEVKQLAEDASDALYQVHGTFFDPINSADLYPAAGASDDWYKGSLGTRYAFTTELRDTGFWGFELPANQIIPSGEELWAGMSVVFDKIVADAQKQ